MNDLKDVQDVSIGMSIGPHCNDVSVGLSEHDRLHHEISVQH